MNWLFGNNTHLCSFLELDKIDTNEKTVLLFTVLDKSSPPNITASTLC